MARSNTGLATENGLAQGDNATPECTTGKDARRAPFRVPYRTSLDADAGSQKQKGRRQNACLYILL
jgi:hypothetical protein